VGEYARSHLSAWGYTAMVDIARHKSRVARKCRDSLLKDEEVLGAFVLLPLGSMKRELTSTVVTNIAGSIAGAASGVTGVGAGVDASLSAALSASELAERRSGVLPGGIARRFPDGRVIFAITNFRFMLFHYQQKLATVDYLFIAAFPLTAITRLRVTPGVSANRIILTFADGTSVLKELPHGQGSPLKLTKAFTRGTVR
jgi:hypothetical protein